MGIKAGLYEQLINDLLARELGALPPGAVLTQTEPIDRAETPYILSRYLRLVIEKSLSFLSGKDEERLVRQVDLCNRILQLLADADVLPDLSDVTVPKDTKMLLAVARRNGLPVMSETPVWPRPVTRLTQSALFTGSRLDPSLASEIAKEILSADRVDILMSFIKWGGLRILLDELERFTARPESRLRIITTSYMGATDLRAVEKLSCLPNTEIKVSYDTRRTRLHAKAYLFHRDTGFTTGYIGSSNMSNAAMTSGLEWNLKVTAEDAPDIVRKFAGTFETYWNDPEFRTYTPESRDELRRALTEAMGAGRPCDDQEFPFDIRPYSYQEVILARLRAEREIHGRYRNLVVAATGTGKTVVAAFDYKAFRERNPGAAGRLLFIAHREEILKQSLSCFRTILKDRNFGELFVGDHRPTQMDHLFLSIQTFHSRRFEETIPPDHYDYIVVDEFHRAEASTYRSFLSHFRPRILLGLTATPERMDGEDVTSHFDHRIAAEIRLPEAIDRKLLCPFQYFGVSDSVDLSGITWARGGYDVGQLDNLYTGNDVRAFEILEALRKYVLHPRKAVGLGFCVSVAHAEYMARFFTDQGIPSAALSGRSGDDHRRTVRERLRAREINFIFVVDLYNEGVDIPEIDTILFLRPTESLTVFLQQLGRGLRLHEDKECLTVLDFIGQSHRNYSFEQKYRVLLGRTHKPVREMIEDGFPHLPSGCVIRLEKVAREHVLENIRQAIHRRRPVLVRKIAAFREESGQELTLRNFIAWHGLSLNDIYVKDCWTRLCVRAGVLDACDDPDEDLLARGIRRTLHLNSRRYISFLLKGLQEPESIHAASRTREGERFLAMFHYDVWQATGERCGIGTFGESLLRVARSPHLRNEFIEVLQHNLDAIDFIDRPVPLPYPCPLDLHCRYTRDEILAAIGLNTLSSRRELREGVLHVNDLRTDLLFVTLRKAEKDYSPSTMYDDYAISDRLFHWQSQSTTSETSSTGRRYIHHQETGNRILLFVREQKKEAGLGAPYHYLGPVRYVRHEGSRPMSIIWELEHPMPPHLWTETETLGVG